MPIVLDSYMLRFRIVENKLYLYSKGGSQSTYSTINSECLPTSLTRVRFHTLRKRKIKYGIFPFYYEIVYFKYDDQMHSVLEYQKYSVSNKTIFRSLNFSRVVECIYFIYFDLISSEAHVPIIFIIWNMANYRAPGRTHKSRPIITEKA